MNTQQWLLKNRAEDYGTDRIDLDGSLGVCASVEHAHSGFTEAKDHPYVLRNRHTLERIVVIGGGPLVESELKRKMTLHAVRHWVGLGWSHQFRAKAEQDPEHEWSIVETQWCQRNSLRYLIGYCDPVAPEWPNFRVPRGLELRNLLMQLRNEGLPVSPLDLDSPRFRASH
ncbi:hypothetical protein HNQ60_000745 [Povalibacter uvarum]|uniref:Uncharacterized protein n=1 Tax=Povalibacter uvarum TaxID=732238 RepID=A0A841HHL7_9GAMM|nr:hypothetical protein [Povalibacter uvarum]MBB6091899.1 hypothetical protein [Povalibacter uvarum]